MISISLLLIMVPCLLLLMSRPLSWLRGPSFSLWPLFDLVHAFHGSLFSFMSSLNWLLPNQCRTQRCWWSLTNFNMSASHVLLWEMASPMNRLFPWTTSCDNTAAIFWSSLAACLISSKHTTLATWEDVIFSTYSAWIYFTIEYSNQHVVTEMLQRATCRTRVTNWTSKSQVEAQV